MRWPILLAALLAASQVGGGVRLDVPVLAQAAERCGPAALTMVLQWYGADSAATTLGDCGYDPVLRGALITDLARCAREAGFLADVEQPREDSLRAMLVSGIPPVLLYERGVNRLARLHYAVLVGWEPERGRYVLHDGGRKPSRMNREALMRRWQAAGGRALVVRRRGP